jgi:hypothetical protein
MFAVLVSIADDLLSMQGASAAVSARFQDEF